ncbi:MAG: hypothetical protein LBK07_04160 [Tannerella sp.]|nr:hypothetical protein [Tannerella sp.]
MKRMIAVFLLTVTLFASGHATLAFHYCGGSLHGVSLAGYAGVQTCCCRTVHHGTSGNHTGIENTPCCENHFVSLITDDYPDARQEAPIAASFEFQSAMFAADNLLHSAENMPPLPLPLLPCDTAPRRVALRHLICIYLI